MIRSTVGTLARRTFLSRFGIAVPLLGSAQPAKKGTGEFHPGTAVPLFGSAQAAGPAAEKGTGEFHAARHPQDDWFDQIPGKHRCFWDTTTAEELGRAILFCNNYLDASKDGYGLEPRDLALIIGVRYQSAAFGFTDAMWAKYSGPLTNWAWRGDARPSQPATKNARMAQLNDLAKRGVQISICDMASHNISRSIARSVDGKADAIYAELIANRVDNPHQVPAGIVALNRAQEHGYTSM